jgi:hypothetical protein
LVSEALVKNMGLEMKPHTKPYPLGWEYDKEKLNVTKQFRVRFAISSKLIDELDLDVVSLDICGIVLGSPYLYDRKEIKNNKIYVLMVIRKKEFKTYDAFQGCDPSHKK